MSDRQRSWRDYSERGASNRQLRSNLGPVAQSANESSSRDLVGHDNLITGVQVDAIEFCSGEKAIDVIEAAMRLPSPPRILNVSTSQVYACSDTALTETSPLDPDSPYAATKAMAEMLTVQYKRCTSGGIITARAFNHTGPGQSPNFVLPSFAKQLAEMEAGLIPPVLKVGNIEVKRDFTDVRDVVAAYHELLNKTKTAEIYNVCSGRAVLLADVLRELQQDCSVTVKVEVDSSRLRPNETAIMLGDRGKIQRVTGWKPRIPLESTLKDLLVYWRTRIKHDSAENNGAPTDAMVSNPSLIGVDHVKLSVSAPLFSAESGLILVRQ